MLPNFHFSIERWRKNIEYGVWVSTEGRVRLIQNKEFLNARIDKSGYCVVFTEKGQQFVHRLVAYTWLGDKRNEKYNIDHINSNKRDNSIKNLRWVKIEINTQYAKYTQTQLDSVDCIEKAEAEEKPLRERITQKQVSLLMDGKLLFDDYPSISKFLKLPNTPPFKVFCTNVLTAIEKDTTYLGHKWEIKECKVDDKN